MKKMTLFSNVLIAGALFASSAAMAAPHEQHLPGMNVHMQQLEMRIDAGVSSGKLTEGEERQVRSALHQLGASVKAALRDHKISKRERSRLAGKEAALNKLITKLSNNRAVVQQEKHRWDDQRDGKRDQRDQRGQRPPMPPMPMQAPPFAQHAK
jgi:hypothetical protein